MAGGDELKQFDVYCFYDLNSRIISAEVSNMLTIRGYQIHMHENASKEEIKQQMQQSRYFLCFLRNFYFSETILATSGFMPIYNLASALNKPAIFVILGKFYTDDEFFLKAAKIYEREGSLIVEQILDELKLTSKFKVSNLKKTEVVEPKRVSYKSLKEILNENSGVDLNGVQTIKAVYEALKYSEKMRPITSAEIKETKEFMEKMKRRKRAEVTDDEILLYVIGKTLEKSDMQMVLSKTKLESDETMLLHTMLLLTGSLLNVKLYQSTFMHDRVQNFDADYINDDTALQKRFISEFKRFMNRSTDIDEEDIHVLAIESGSVKVTWCTVRQPVIDEKIAKRKKVFECSHLGTEEIKLLSRVLISAEIFDSEYDMDYTGSTFYERVEKRGQENYYYPFGWKRRALDLEHFAYFRGVDKNWITMNHDNEWSIVFNGFKEALRKQSVVNCKAYDSVKDENKRNRDGFGKPCGTGVYCTTKVDIAEYYTTLIPHDGRNYKLALQCRINPQKFRNASDNLYIINDFVNDIRPYGILFKTEP